MKQWVPEKAIRVEIRSATDTIREPKFDCEIKK
jgi:hypothetical protein